MKKQTVTAVSSLVLALSLGLVGCGGAAPDASSSQGSETPAAVEEPVEELSEEERAYRDAQALMDEKKWGEAVPLLRDLGDYEDSKELLRSAAYRCVREYLSEHGGPIDDLGFGANTKSDHAIIKELPNDAEGRMDIGYVLLDDDNHIVIGGGTEYSNDDSSFASAYEIILRRNSKKAKVKELGYVTILHARNIEGASGTIKLSRYGIDSRPEYDSVLTSIVKYDGTEVDEEIAPEDAVILGAGVFDEAREFGLRSFDELLAETGVTLYDLGFDKMAGGVPADDDTEEVAEDAEEIIEGAEAAVEDAAAQPAADDAIDLTVEGGELKFVEWTYAPEGFMVEGEPEDYILAVFDYTNFEDSAKQCQNDFWVRAYQNGVELDTGGSYHGDKSEYRENYFKTVLKDGTIRVAMVYQLSDRSPVTLIANQQAHNDVTAQMTINLE